MSDPNKYVTDVVIRVFDVDGMQVNHVNVYDKCGGKTDHYLINNYEFKVPKVTIGLHYFDVNIVVDRSPRNYEISTGIPVYIDSHCQEVDLEMASKEGWSIKRKEIEKLEMKGQGEKAFELLIKARSHFRGIKFELIDKDDFFGVTEKMLSKRPGFNVDQFKLEFSDFKLDNREF